MYNVYVQRRSIYCVYIYISTRHVGKGDWIFFDFKETLSIEDFIFACFLSLSFGETTELIFYISPHLSLICK